LVWFKFLLCIVIILFAGTKTTRYADIIARRTGLGRIWIGMLLLGIVTSAPELITGISSVTLVGEAGVPDLGLGTLLGSCIYNISVLVVLDVIYRNGPVLNQASRRQIASAGLGIILLAIAAAGIYFNDNLSGLSLGWVGVPGIVIFVLYILGAWRTFRSERNFNVPLIPDATAQAEESPVVKWLWLKFVFGALVVVGAGVWLSFVGNEIAEVTRWDTSFVGSLFLAISTSVPETVVAISALRLGAVDLAVADILGANMLDVTYIFLLDLCYTRAPILSSVVGLYIFAAYMLFTSGIAGG